MKDIKSMSLAELAQDLADQPSFRAKQIFVWLQRGARSFSEMTNLSKPLRERLEREYTITAPIAARKLQSAKDGTIKYLWRLADGNCVETVLMRYHHGNTVCISSEVGCAMGCAFCASTRGGLVRRLTASEMLDEVLFTQIDSGEPIANIVLMGIGEPLDNYDAVLRFLHMVNAKEGMNIGMRHISLSTCGLADKIDRLAQENLQITLSVSLHAADNAVRSSLMPINRKYDVETLLASCRNYFEKTGRRITFEYAMIRGVNDSQVDAALLAKKLGCMQAHVNLIPLNNVAESPLKPSSSETVRAFAQQLAQMHIPATVRRSLGGDIDAACGQLRRNYEEQVCAKEAFGFDRGLGSD
ncbi:MAG: 23S rRNA (adenine(2503)-C(2))-methyltransferase RlmN [Oscillospiraceae bacterium]|nr:23S rRNA (adenine(2503)-C(2))-methyltransferase RlmN [Oscillospiraceae bacterium]